MDRKAWPALKEKLTKVFKSKSRADWCKIMEGTDICFAPILTMAEAPKHPHMAARKVFVERHGVTQPAPAPRFSRTPSAIREPEVANIGDVTSAWKADKQCHRPGWSEGRRRRTSSTDSGFDALASPRNDDRDDALRRISTFSTPLRI